MAFTKYSQAVISHPSVITGSKKNGWAKVRRKAGKKGFDKTAASLLRNYPPDKFLLTHCTIIASVDVEKVEGVKTGSKVAVNGSHINRKWDDYHITPETSKYVNANLDSWDRPTLLNTYHTFIGAENYVEHVQVPELSKGKIADAVARDLGDTVYVDILVATDRKHKQLVSDIESGKVNAMSMGCSIAYSRCSKCGNVAAEEEDLCKHVKHEKGDYFVDDNGVKRIVAELCGHHTDPESVTFIEASWVAAPAFKGAVLRQVLNGSKGFSEDARAATALSQGSVIASSSLLTEFMEAQNNDAFNLLSASKKKQHKLRAARAMAKYALGFDDDEEEEGEEEDPLTQIKEDIKGKLRSDLKKELQKELEDELGFLPEEPMFEGPENKVDLNDNIVNSYHAFSSKYAGELGSRTRPVFYALYTASWQGWGKVAGLSKEVTRADKVAAMYIRDRDFKKASLHPDIYLCLNEAGPLSKYSTDLVYLRKCQGLIGRGLTRRESKTLIKRNKKLG